MPRMRVRDLMTTDLVTLDAHESLLLADDVMRLGRIRHLPVVSGRKLVGLVSHRDLLRASISSLAGMSREEELSLKRSIPVREVMRRDLITVGPDEPALSACKTLLERKLGCLPVVDGEGNLVGIVTEADFVDLARRFLEAESA